MTERPPKFGRKSGSRIIMYVYSLEYASNAGLTLHLLVPSAPGCQMCGSETQGIIRRSHLPLCFLSHSNYTFLGGHKVSMIR